MKKRGSYNAEKEKLKAQVKEHIVVKGFAVEATAKELGVSQKSISNWIKSGNWKSRSKQEQRKLRNKAKYLIVVKGLQQKEVSKIIGVSEKSISLWSKDGHWQEDIKKNLKPEGSIKDFIAKFFMYLFLMEPDIMERVKKRWYEFMKSEEKDIEI